MVAAVEVVAMRRRRDGDRDGGMEACEDGDGGDPTAEVDPSEDGSGVGEARRGGATGAACRQQMAAACGNQMHSRRRKAGSWRRWWQADNGRWCHWRQRYCGCGGRRHDGGDRDYGGRRHGGLGQLAGGVADDRT